MNHNPGFLAPDPAGAMWDALALLKQDMPLTDCLIAMQTAEGIDAEEARTHAEDCMAAICVWDTIRQEISDDSLAVMDRFLSGLTALEEDRRLDALHRLHFGLSLWDDPENAAAMEGGASAEQLYWSFREKLTAQGVTFTPEELENRIRKDLAGYRLSPAAMGLLTRNMRRGDGCLATAEALSTEGRALKCIATMDLWLRNRDTMTMGTAAAEAAAATEVQAVEDALQRGYLTRSAAKKILIAIGIALVIFGIVCMVQSMPVVTEGILGFAKAAESPFHVFSSYMQQFAEPFRRMHIRGLTKQAKGALMTLGGSAVALLSEKAAGWIARASLSFSGLRRPDPAAPAVLDEAADFIPAASAETAPDSFLYPEDRAEDWAEEEDPAFF